MNNTDTKTLNRLLEQYAEAHAELKSELEKEMLWLRQDLESLELNALGPYERTSLSESYRERQWYLKLEIIDQCERMNIDPQVYLSGANNGPF